MPLIDSRGKLFGAVNVLDGLIVATTILSVLGVAAVKSGATSLSKIIEKEGPAEIDLFIKANFEDLAMFKKGDKAFVTIRNQPYDKVEIANVLTKRSIISVPINDGKDFRLTTDPANPYSTEVVLTLRDKAAQTEDGIVWGGQKLKVGVPIDVEGFKYRLRGSVLDVRMVDTAAPAPAASPSTTP
ncbi:MAG: hypothetical protein JWM80_1305 [Cyanobacteria bacterium RYN_339]|nr:hypothetical protein [Cyanobacteria bacterium RYN_339]